MIDGLARSDLPTILSPRGIIAEPSDYLRQLAVDGSAPATTLQTYGKILRQFWSRLEGDGRSWERVNDAYLRRWRDEMDKKERLKRATINQKLRSVFAFYVWAEQTGRLTGVVDLTGSRFAQLPISTRVSRDGVRSCPLVFRTEEEPNRHTPTDNEVDRLHSVLTGRHAVRNGLILTWAEQTALRRSEILSITVAQIPSRSLIQELYDCEEVHTVHVKVKGGRTCAVHVLPSLLEQTLDYVQFERAETMARARARLPQLKDTGALFLSETGRVPTPNSVSRIAGRLFVRARVKDASLHRLRAVHLTRLAERYIDLVDEYGVPLSTETIAIKIRDAARWVGTSSLHRYIEAARGRRADIATQRQSANWGIEWSEETNSRSETEVGHRPSGREQPDRGD